MNCQTVNFSPKKFVHEIKIKVFRCDPKIKAKSKQSNDATSMIDLIEKGLHE